MSLKDTLCMDDLFDDEQQLEMMAMEGSNIMDDPDFPENWMQAIMADDIQVIQAVLQQFRNSSFDILHPESGALARVRKNLDSPNSSQNAMKGKDSYDITCPWILACCYGARNTLTFFYKEGVDVLHQDSKGNNCIHNMIILSADKSMEESEAFETFKFLQSVLSEGEMHFLLQQENKRALRPLEEAMFQETLQIFTAIFETKTYLLKRERVGIRTVEYYNVTEYETNGPESRLDRSPLLFLTMIRKGQRYSKYALEILQEPLHTWSVAKKSSYIPFIYSWAAFRLLFMGFYFYSVSMILNISPSIQPDLLSNASMSKSKADYESLATIKLHITLNDAQKSIMITALILSSLILTLDITEFALGLVPKPWRESFFVPKRNLLAQVRFYRLTQLLVVGLTTFLCSVILHLENGGELNLDLMYLQIAFAAIVSISVWPVLYFVQLIPWLGHFVVAVQRMIRDLFQFFVMYILFLFPYVFTFFLALNGYNDRNFSTFFRASYSTFLTMLNMVNLSQYTIFFTMLTFLHFFFVFMVSVLLINFLIAMFSTSYADVANNQDVIFIIQSLSVVWVLERRLISLLSPLIAYIKRRYFVYENNRYFVTKVIIAR